VSEREKVLCAFVCVLCGETLTTVRRVEVKSSALNDVVSRKDRRLSIALVLCWLLRSVTVLHVLDYLYRITSNYGVSTLSLDDGGNFRQPISTRHLEATTGMFTFFVLLCVCVCSVCFVCFYWSLSPPTHAGVPVVLGCPLRCVRALNFVHYVRCVNFFTQDDCVRSVRYYRNRRTL